MNSRFGNWILAALIVALVLGAATLGAVLARPGTTQAAQPIGTGIVRQITVVGTGEVKATPDQATVQIGVQTEGATSSEAMAANNTQMAALIEQIKQLGIAEKDIQTSNFSISPTYGTDGRAVTGYQVNNMVAVTIRNIAQTGDLLDKVVKAGANSVWGINFGISDPNTLQASARDAAIADARTRAEAMAKAAQGTVGQVLTITESIGSVPQPLVMRADTKVEAADAVPIATGEQVVSAQVQITFELR
jgi:uncharacterized protein YggE